MPKAGGLPPGCGGPAARPVPESREDPAMNFDLTDLRLFLAVVETGSITAGAERSALSLAAASARIRNLEHQAGVALFERSRRGVAATAAGRALLVHARRLRQDVERLRADMSEHAAGGKAMLRMLANTAAMSEWLPEILADFLRTTPGVDLALSERGSEAAVAALREGGADIAVVAGHAALDGLDIAPFRPDRLVLAVPLAHPLAAAGGVHLREVAAHDFIGLTSDSALQQHVASQLLRSGVRLQVRAQVHGCDAVCRMVARGAGLAVLPLVALARSSVRDQLVAVTLHDAWAHRQMWLALRPDARPDTPLWRLRDWLLAQAALAGPSAATPD
jgi:DNA-binding transcriptional LysR family regulator